MIDFIKKHRVDNKNIKLSKIETSESSPFDQKADAVAFTKKAIDEIRKLQYRLFVESKQSLLIVLQGARCRRQRRIDS